MNDFVKILAWQVGVEGRPTPGGAEEQAGRRRASLFSSRAANGPLHNLKEALLDNVDIYGDCSEFNTVGG